MQGRISGPVPQGLTLFETMRAEPDGTIRRWPLHLARLERSCAAVGFPLNADEANAAVANLPQGQALRVRLVVDGSGAINLTHASAPEAPSEWRVAISAERLQAGDPWLGIKSSARGVYDAARAAMPAVADEVILLNDQGQVCEGSITNLFLLRAGKMLTPPVACGLLPGVLRAELLASGMAREAVLMPKDLSNGRLFCGNALRGLIPARLI
ncbi:aminotransferase class IV [Paracoccus sp. R86501]|uniref:aminotransferase class IV n=1 Tax=Paracoccus sp. R86501 TaxID=3101711 RepID=UPI0036715A54